MKTKEKAKENETYIICLTFFVSCKGSEALGTEHEDSKKDTKIRRQSK